jgi:hypothetical protein
MALTLSHTPGEWDGTFAVVLDALVRDLLSDGAPFAATVVYWDPYRRDETSVSGEVSAITDDGDLIVDMVPMPSSVSVSDVIGVMVP